MEALEHCTHSSLQVASKVITAFLSTQQKQATGPELRLTVSPHLNSCIVSKTIKQRSYKTVYGPFFESSQTGNPPIQPRETLMVNVCHILFPSCTFFSPLMSPLVSFLSPLSLSLWCLRQGFSVLSPGYPETCSVDQAGLELTEICLTLCPECWY